MRLERLTPAHVRRAVQIYLDYAWPPDKPGKPRLTVKDLEGATTLKELSHHFEQPRSEEGVACKRFALRLGNSRYPFMKFIVQEYLVHEEYFFSVDTHDDLKITPDMSDFEGWCELREFNRGLKQKIEDAWDGADLPTNKDLQALMEGLAQLETGEDKSARLLVVDDEESVARGLAAVLRARGYQVEVAFDGLEVLERMRADPLPDLVVLDYAMPELDGEEVMRRLKADERCCEVPILLATATQIDLAKLPPASGFLRKPYPRELLFTMIRQLLGIEAASATD
ncbi:MAG: response regulator [bacterium]|nr:response regulator [bacterium]